MSERRKRVDKRVARKRCEGKKKIQIQSERGGWEIMNNERKTG